MDMETTKIDIRQHRRYDFLHDFNLDWYKLDAGDDEETKRYENLTEDYYVFNLDCFEHGCICFSLVNDRRDIGYYEFDRSRNVGIIAVQKDDYSPKEAIEIARDRIEEYNNYINGRDEEE